MWILYAIGSALFAALTAITAKIGITNVDSNLGTAIRTFVVLIIATGIVFSTKSFSQLPNITAKSWIFLIISGFMTGLSWLCYFKALQLGDTTKVVTIDKFSLVFVLIIYFNFKRRYKSKNVYRLSFNHSRYNIDGRLKYLF